MTDKKYTVGVDVGCGGAIAVLDTDFNYIDHLRNANYQDG